MIRSHRTILVVALGILCFFYLLSLVRKQSEGFEDLPLPHEMFKTLRGLLDKYDKPEVWNHAIQMSNKSPADLARLQLAEGQAQGN